MQSNNDLKSLTKHIDPRLATKFEDSNLGLISNCCQKW